MTKKSPHYILGELIGKLEEIFLRDTTISDDNYIIIMELIEEIEKSLPKPF